MKKSGAGILVEELIRQGVETIFGYPGGYVLSIYDELYNSGQRIRHILPAHEQGAAHAADAYARVSGKPGVVIATGGPGATNLVTGIANAYLDSVPVVFITGNVAVPMLGQDSFQDIDIVGVTLPIVKHSYIVKDISDLQGCINEAFQIASSGRKGPVHIDIPKNVQQDTFEYDPIFKLPNFNKYNQTNTLPNAKSQAIDSIVLDAALRLIEKSKRPFIYCGGGVTVTSTGSEIIKLSKKLGAPVGMSLMGLGSVPHSYELNLGMSGMHGRYASIVAKSEADLIFAAGVRFSDRATGNAVEYAKDTAVLHIDIEPAEIGKTIKPDVSICGDLREVLPALLENLDSINLNANEKWIKRIKELRTEDNIPFGDEFVPRNIISCVNEHYDKETIIATDVGQHQMWVAQYYRFEYPRTLVTSGGLGAMGYGMGAAIGASIAKGGARTVLFTGDGSFGMNHTELATAVTRELPITIILLNNKSLGMVRQWQTLFLEKRYSNTSLERETDFPALAKAYGAQGHTASDITELKNILDKATDNTPCLIECAVDIDEMVLPMIPIGSSIEDMIRI